MSQGFKRKKIGRWVLTIKVLLVRDGYVGKRTKLLRRKNNDRRISFRRRLIVNGSTYFIFDEIVSGGELGN